MSHAQESTLPINKSPSTMIDTLKSFKDKIDHVMEIKKTPDSQRAVEEYYKKELRPLMLAMRFQNRENKKQLVTRAEELKKLETDLIALQSLYDSLNYKLSALAFDANQKRTRDVSVTSLEDYKEKMQALEVEETQRRELHLQRNSLEEESKALETICTKGDLQWKEVKPYAKQYVEKAALILNLDELS